jgi:hypothetical protein
MVPVVDPLDPNGLLQLHLGIIDFLSTDDTITILIVLFLVLILGNIWIEVLLD